MIDWAKQLLQNFMECRFSVVDSRGDQSSGYRTVLVSRLGHGGTRYFTSSFLQPQVEWTGVENQLDCRDLLPSQLISREPSS
jgi:hypothetical protein